MYQHLIIALLGLASASSASAPHYQCTIQQVYKLSEDGDLHPVQAPEATQRGFVVDRTTGMVVGQSISNASTGSRTVLDFGDAEHPFKLVWVSQIQPGRRQFQSLIIEENVSGKRKPFIAQSAFGMVTGTCQS